MSSTSKEQIAPFAINSDNSKKKVALFQKFLNEKDVVIRFVFLFILIYLTPFRIACLFCSPSAIQDPSGLFIIKECVHFHP